MKADGVINLYKPKGITSQTAVNIVKRIYGVKKAGHCGTLDPDAVGVLPVMIGNGVKLSEMLIDHDKSYKAAIQLGYETSTGDVSGEVTAKTGFIPDFDTLKQAANSFLGGYEQMPPMYSALKVNGVKLVNAARKGVEIERKPRKINIYSIDLYFENGEYILYTHCSRGTYIRTLCEDIAKKAGTMGCMKSLERTSCGVFKAENAVALDELQIKTQEELCEYIIPVEDILCDMPKIILTRFYENLIRNGCSVDAEKLGIKSQDSIKEYRLYGQNGFFAIAEVTETDGRKTIKHKKLFI